MRWSYFKNVRNINVGYYFKKRNLTSRQMIKDHLDKNNFTYSQDELKIIYDEALPEKKVEPKKQIKKEVKREKPLLSQKKKRIRNSSKRKRYVSGSLDK